MHCTVWIDVHAIDWLKFAWREKNRNYKKKVRQPENEWENRFRSVLQYSFSSYSLSADEKNCLESSFNQNFIITTTICFIIHALTCTSKMEFEVLQLVRYSLFLSRSLTRSACAEFWMKIERHFWLNNKAWNRSEYVFKKRTKMRARCRLNQSPTKYFSCVYRSRREIMHAYRSKRKTINHFYNWFC